MFFSLHIISNYYYETSQPGRVCFQISLFFKKTNFAILHSNQTNDGTFSNKAGENFKLANIFLNVGVWL